MHEILKKHEAFFRQVCHLSKSTQTGQARTQRYYRIKTTYKKTKNIRIKNHSFIIN